MFGREYIMSNGGKLIFELLSEFFQEEKIRTAAIIILSLLVNVIHASGVSSVNAYIIDSIQGSHEANTYKYFKYFIVISFVFILIFLIYKYLQNQLLTKLRQWIREKILFKILKANNENMTLINYTKMNTPIKRIALVAHLIFTDIFSGLLPHVSFLIIIGAYLFYICPQIGFIYILTNLIFGSLIYNNWDNMMHINEVYEKAEFENDGDLLEILNNVDKIIYRGQTEYESNIFSKKVENVVSKALAFYGSTDMFGGALSFVVGGSVIFMVYKAIKLFYSGEISAVSFITIMTMLILYRDKVSSLVQMIPEFVEFTGRITMMENMFSGMDLLSENTNLRKELNLPFRHIQFKNVSFKYQKSDTATLDAINLDIHATGGKTIGITGVSGRGKSTLVRLLLKIHYPDSGEILIDGEPIQTIDADYIRHNITYVNQTGKLFDRKVVENIMYACHEPEKCERNLARILNTYPHIKRMFANLDLNKKSGSLGESLSGGQRQIVNILSGLIQDTKILVLDEPTNALDPDLKKEVMNIIRDFGKNKNAVIIITHDEEIMPMFNQVIHLT